MSLQKCYLDEYFKCLWVQFRQQMRTKRGRVCIKSSFIHIHLYIRWLLWLCKSIVCSYRLVGEGSTTSSTPDLCTGTFIKKVKLPSSCSFEHGACGYTSTKTGLAWAIRTGKYGYGSNGITAAHGGSGKCKVKWTTGVGLFYDLLLVMITCCIVYVTPTTHV